MCCRVLVLARNYPNHVIPTLGLWVEGLVRCIADLCEIRVVAPVPYCPPLPSFVGYSRFRNILRREEFHGIDVLRPRFLTGPGYSLHSIEASTYYWGIYKQVDRLRREFPFDVIHAHFGYPEGVVGVRLGRRYRVPVVITEHAPWLPWMENYPAVRRQAVRASRECCFHIAVSQYVRSTISHFTGESDRLRVIPIGVDCSVFVPGSSGERRKPNPEQILYVGRLQSTKGVDVLLHAMCQLITRRPTLKLLIVGGSLPYRNHLRQDKKLRALVADMGLQKKIEFVGVKPPREVAAYMQESALLVLPSRAESFGATLIEALACGTPVVATRSGGPEDIVRDDVGLLTPTNDPNALANAIEHILQAPEAFEAARLRNYALQNFSWERIARETVDLYRQALESKGDRPQESRN